MRSLRSRATSSVALWFACLLCALADALSRGTLAAGAGSGGAEGGGEGVECGGVFAADGDDAVGAVEADAAVGVSLDGSDGHYE